MGYFSVETYYNVLYEEFGFRLSGNRHELVYPEIKNVTFTHPIMDGVYHIYPSYPYVATLTLLNYPAESILNAEGTPLFWFLCMGREEFLLT